MKWITDKVLSRNVVPIDVRYIIRYVLRILTGYCWIVDFICFLMEVDQVSYYSFYFLLVLVYICCVYYFFSCNVCFLALLLVIKFWSLLCLYFLSRNMPLNKCTVSRSIRKLTCITFYICIKCSWKVRQFLYILLQFAFPCGKSSDKIWYLNTRKSWNVF